MPGVIKPSRAVRMNRLRDGTMDDPPPSDERNWPRDGVAAPAGAPVAVPAATFGEIRMLASALEQQLSCICNPVLPI